MKKRPFGGVLHCVCIFIYRIKHSMGRAELQALCNKVRELYGVLRRDIEKWPYFLQKTIYPPTQREYNKENQEGGIYYERLS